jgi:hypothetical protein
MSAPEVLRNDLCGAGLGVQTLTYRLKEVLCAPHVMLKLDPSLRRDDEPAKARTMFARQFVT